MAGHTTNDGTGFTGSPTQVTNDTQLYSALTSSRYTLLVSVFTFASDSFDRPANKSSIRRRKRSTRHSRCIPCPRSLPITTWPKRLLEIPSSRAWAGSSPTRRLRMAFQRSITGELPLSSVRHREHNADTSLLCRWNTPGRACSGV